MPKENATAGTNARAKVVEVSGQQPESQTQSNVPADETPKLSRRDALQVAIAATKDEKPGSDLNPVPERKIKSSPLEKTETTSSTSSEEKPLEAPAEFSPEEKEDFKLLSRKGQEAQLRLHNSGKKRIAEIKKATEEHDKKLAARQSFEKLEPGLNMFLKAHGINMPAEVALTRALEMWKEFNVPAGDEAGAKAAVAAYLQARKIPVPKELLNGAAAPAARSENDPLQKKVDELSSKVERDELQQRGMFFANVWNTFESEKNASGKLKYPVDWETEKGQELARDIGSLVGGQTSLSRDFIAKCQKRIPNLTYLRLFHEAYVYCGGEVDESAAPRTQDTQKHVRQSAAAASSRPGGTGSSDVGAVKKYKTRREALAAAVSELRERDGA